MRLKGQGIFLLSAVAIARITSTTTARKGERKRRRKVSLPPPGMGGGRGSRGTYLAHLAMKKVMGRGRRRRSLSSFALPTNTVGKGIDTVTSRKVA